MEKQDTPTPENPEKRTTSKLRIYLLPIALVAIALATAFNSYAIFAVTSGVSQFPGASLFSIAAQYQYGAVPNGAIILPGDNVNFTLTVTNNAQHVTNLAIFFNATDPNDWNVAFDQTCTLIKGTLTMALDGTTILLPINNSGPTICGGLSIPTQVVLPMSHGTNKILGNIAVSPGASIGLSFTIQWFGQPA